jgi:TonB family protein
MLVAVSSICYSQQVITKYYKKRPFETEVDAKKARYSVTTINEENGVQTVTEKDLEKDAIISSHRGDEPIGVWGTGKNTLDFDFQVKYSTGICVGDPEVGEIMTWYQDLSDIGYTAPVIDGNYTGMSNFLIRNLRYPAQARRYGIEGAVILSFAITSQGNVENIVVSKGVHIVLDKEAVRLIRLLKFSKPPMVNGKPVTICATFPLRFKLN